jgi:ribonuclease HI
MEKYLLQFDGASEPNPGPSGAAYVIYSPPKIQGDELIREVIQEGYKYIPHGTNNEAEYSALILGLTEALKLGITNLQIEGDSNLVIQQVQGKWKVKAPHIVPYRSKANSLLAKFKSYSLSHIPREENTDADSLSKEAIETKMTLFRKSESALQVNNNVHPL